MAMIAQWRIRKAFIENTIHLLLGILLAGLVCTPSDG